MADVLEQILDGRRRSVQRAKSAKSLDEVEREAEKAPLCRPFKAGLQGSGAVRVIAEMKRRSPSAGVIRDPYEPAEVAKAYERGGAAALSVLTEPDWFAGSLEDLSRARAAVALPVLRKDFIFDRYQVAEARAAGADAVLLIADALTADGLRDLAEYALSFGMEPLVEVFTAAVVPAALESGAELIGINTRNLRTLEMNPDNVAALSSIIPEDRLIVAESGIKSAEDVRRLARHRVSAVLVGESILKQRDLEAGVRELANATAS